jgi:hypothetical protein
MVEQVSDEKQEIPVLLKKRPEDTKEEGQPVPPEEHDSYGTELLAHLEDD